MYVGLSEEVSFLPDFGTMVCKYGPFYVVIAFSLITLFGIRLCFCLYLFLQSRYDMFREFIVLGYVVYSHPFCLPLLLISYIFLQNTCTSGRCTSFKYS